MSGILQGKNALITGAASGIGHEAAIIFAKHGANVLMVDVKIDAAIADKVKATLPPGSKIVVGFFEADVADDKKVQEAVTRAKALGSSGHLDIMFNNAGIQHPQDADVTDDATISTALSKTLDVNVKGVLICCKWAIEAMKQTGGSIINSSNFAALVGSAIPHVAFAASKGAVISLTRELAVTHAKDKIRVNSLVPGPVNTPQSFGSEAMKDANLKIAWLSRMPMGRPAEPAEIANAALFLASDLSSYITGSEIVVDGGASSSFIVKAVAK